MESEEDRNTSEANDSVEEQLQHMIARLEALRSSKTETSTAAPDFDELQAKAALLIKSPESSIEPEFLCKLEKAVKSLPSGPQQCYLADALNTLRKRLQKQFEQTELKFPFNVLKNTAEPPEDQEIEFPRNEECVGKSLNPLDSLIRAALEARESKAIREITNKHDEEIVIDGEGGKQITLRNIANCVIRVPSQAAAIYMKSVKHSTLIFAPVKNLVVIRDCEDSTIAASAQQIQIHSSHQMRLYIEVRGDIMIDDSDGIEVAPYNVTGVERDPENDGWRKVQDYSWYPNEATSPHWKIMTENSTKCFSL